MLESKEIQTILTHPSSDVVKGRLYESHLRIYTEALEKDELSKERGWRQLMEVNASRLHKDKVKSVQDFFTYPLEVVRETSDCLRELYRVFDARNPTFSYSYGTTASETLGLQLMERIDPHSYIERTAKQVLKNRPNTFVVLDKDDKGDVYILTVDNDRLINFKFEEYSTTELEYIVFLHHSAMEDGKAVQYVSYYDKEDYRVYRRVEGGAPVLETSSPHNLGRCPARPFLSATRAECTKLDRFNPFTEVRAKLANFTLFKSHVLHSEYYVSFPIMQMPRQTCANEDCEDGFIYSSVEVAGEITKTTRECPVCSEKSIVLGSGSTFEVDPAEYNDERDVAGYLSFIGPPLDNIKYQDDKQTQRRLEIKEAVTGINDLMSDQAVNIEQVRAVMESAKKPLSFIARQLDVLDKWIWETAHLLQADIKMTRFANWGTEWYLLTEEQIQALYEQAKKIGLPEAEVRELYTLLVETKYKGNPDQLRAKMIELNVNPAPFSSEQEAYDRYTRGAMPVEEWILKANFNNYILKFERNNGHLSKFGKEALESGNSTLSTIINNIKQTLLSYAAEDNQGESITDSPSAGDDSDNRLPQS